MFFSQAEDAVAQDEARGDVGIGAEELRQDWHEMDASKPDRGSDDQFACRRRVFAGGGAFDLGDVRKDPLEPGDIGRAGIGLAPAVAPIDRRP
jgi:hypothetical protein